MAYSSYYVCVRVAPEDFAQFRELLTTEKRQTGRSYRSLQNRVLVETIPYLPPYTPAMRDPRPKQSVDLDLFRDARELLDQRWLETSESISSIARRAIAQYLTSATQSHAQPR